MELKNTIFVGPQKTGTSLIFDYLSLTSISLTYPKETFFFELNNNININNYLNNFVDASDHFAEVSPSYFSSEKARLNIKSILPNSQIVIGIREPRDLVKSYIFHLYSLGLLSQSDLLKEELPLKTNLDNISYSKFILKWLDDFNNVTIYSFDKYCRSEQYRIKLFTSLFRNIDFSLFNEINLPQSNRAFSYPRSVSFLRQITPYMNLIPFSKSLIFLKNKALNFIPKNYSPPKIDINKPSIVNYINEQNKFLNLYNLENLSISDF